MNNTLTENTKIFIKEIVKNHIKNNYHEYISNENKPEYPKINFIDFFTKVYYNNHQ